MNLRIDVDPTAGRVISHDAGRRLDQGLGSLTDLDLNVLFESSNGMTVRRISRKHRVPEAIVRHIVSSQDFRSAVAFAGIASGDSDIYSPLVRRLDELAAPRCGSCHQVLRKALEPHRRGRPPRYCDARCRAAGAKSPAPPRWQTGYIGTCHNYLHGCRCPGKETTTAEDGMVLVTPGLHVLVLGRSVGSIGFLTTAVPAIPIIAGGMTHYDRGELARAAGVPIESVPAREFAWHTAIRLLAGALQRDSGCRRVAILVPDSTSRMIARSFDFRVATRLDRLDKTEANMVWDLVKHPPPPTHVVA
ncbi:hypothetical protein [Allorhizocola rhizosphaerae]|uniref:hypothetical protein n=1 Tax=Allorhizocola rhizosphaerae TaxID=1872709 RepID=UPI000E3E4F54|nr:hypothetical protein [Allorhizocola rhizosphaerae]